MKLDRDFLEFCAALSANGARYLIVGGYAVAAHGSVRYTKDLDVWIEVAADNAQRVVRALEEFGFAGLDLKAADFLDPEVVVQLGYPPVRIDLMTSASGVRFEECYPVRTELEIDGIRVPFIDLENLRKNKQASGRPQDLADLAALNPGR